MTVYVCPYCCHELRENSSSEYYCPKCRKTIRINKWQEFLENTFDEKAFDKVFSSKGLTQELKLMEEGEKVSLDYKDDYFIPQRLKWSIDSKSALVRNQSGKWKLKKTGDNPVFIIRPVYKNGEKENNRIELQKGKDPEELYDGDAIERFRDGDNYEDVDSVELRNGDTIEIKGVKTNDGKIKDISLKVVISYCIDNDNYRNYNSKVFINPNGYLKTDSDNQDYYIIPKELTKIRIGLERSGALKPDLILKPDSANAGVNPKALLYKIKIDESESWWICDLSEGFHFLKVNGKKIHNKELFWGDTITIGNQNFKYGFNKLIKLEKSEDNFSLEVQDLKVNEATGISFRVDPKEFIGLLGPSGSGKTSLIYHLVGLTDYKEGTINGKENHSNLPRCSYMHQQPALHETLTVRQECDCFARLYTKIPLKDIEDYTDAVLQLVDLNNKKQQQVRTLSGGEKKRLCIAMELLREPKILILDEPTSGLDPANEKEIMKHLRRIADQGKIVICSTHMMGSIDKFTKVIILNRNGKIDFFDNPKDAPAQYGVENFSDIYWKLLKNTRPKDPYDPENESDVSKFDPENESDSENETLPKWTRQIWAFFKRVFNDASKSDPEKESDAENETLPNRSRQFWAYFKRDVHQLFSFLHYSPEVRQINFLPVKSINSLIENFVKWFKWSWNFIVRSDFSFLLLIQPFFIALFISISCYAKFFSQLPQQSNAGIFYFFCLISVFWLGMNNSIQELASERIPGRCLERLNNISLKVYIPEKMTWTLVLSFCQTLIFCSWLYAFVPHKEVDSSNLVIIFDISWVTFWIFIVLFSMCVLGAWTALAVSATYCETVALSVMPLILIPLLLFSYAVMKDDPKCEWGMKLEKCLPCEIPLELIESLNNYSFEVKQQEHSNLDQSQEKSGFINKFKNIISNFKYYSGVVYDFVIDFIKTKYIQIVWYLLIVYFIFSKQRKNEKAWEGR